MDKRTIIAMALIALILILMGPYYQYIGVTKPQKNDASTDSTEVAADTSPTQLDSTGGIDSVAPTPDQGGGGVFEGPSAAGYAIDTLPEEFTTVTTDLFEAEISSRGASIRSLRLNDFAYVDGSRIELIPERDFYPLAFEFPEAGGLRSGDIHFMADRSAVELRGRGPDTAVLTFTGATPAGAPLTVQYTFRRKSYLIGMKITAGRDGELARVTRLNVKWQGGLDPTEANRADDYRRFAAYVKQGGEVEKFDDFDDGRLQESSFGSVEWVGTKSKYFLVALLRSDDMAEDFSVTATERKAVEKGQEVARREFQVQIGNRLQSDTEPQFELYLGPVDYTILNSLGHDLDKTVEMGYSFLRPFSVAIIWFARHLHQVIPNYGWVIIIFSLIMKLVFYPFSRKQYQQMARMKQMQPRMKELQEKYKDKPQELQKRMMKLYKEEGFNPLGGCIWMLPQLPVFMALWGVFQASIDLRHAGFMGLSDLSQPSIVLTLLMSLAMLAQQLLTNKDPKQRFMVFGMPVIMFFVFKGFPAGLVLYWLVSNILSIGEQLNVNRGIEPAATTGGTESGSESRQAAKK